MPWTPGDATKHTKKASTPGRQKRWADVANRALASGDSEAVAIRKANASVNAHRSRG